MKILALMVTLMPLFATSERAVDTAKRVLAEKFHIAEEAIELREVGRAEWRGPGVRCEAPREADEVVEGHRVVLAVAPNVYVLHASEDAAVICGLNPTPAVAALPETPNPRHRKLVDHARSDLVGRLRIGANEILLVDVVDVTWPDASLGCPQPGMSYPQVLTEGTRIRFRVGPRVYQYHVGPGGAPRFCDRPEAVEPLAER